MLMQHVFRRDVLQDSLRLKELQVRLPVPRTDCRPTRLQRIEDEQLIENEEGGSIPADLAARIHAKYPRVLIEMHDMIAGGSPIRHTPLYYTYGLPGSWDENWGDDRARTIEGSIRLAELGLDPARAYVFDEPWASCVDGKLVVKAALGPWGAKMASAEGR